MLEDLILDVLVELPLVLHVLRGCDRRIEPVHLRPISMLQVRHDGPQAWEVMTGLILQAVRLGHGHPT